ncbi:MAG: hypothetical protein RQ753_10550 [Desulfurivibrionaceae bacterium]|nr:hypothetical protein [Desulfurivibrionaceae bacterium]
MEIRNELDQVGIGIYHNRFVTALEKVAAAVPLPINPTRIAEGKVLHDPGKGNLPHLDCEMYMVRHQTIGVNPTAESAEHFLKKKKKTAPVRFFEKNILPGITTLDHMIKSAGIMKSRFASHNEKYLP